MRNSNVITAHVRSQNVSGYTIFKCKAVEANWLAHNVRVYAREVVNIYHSLDA